MQDINTKEKKEIIIDSNSDKITMVRFGKNISHKIINISNEPAIMLAYATKLFNRENPDQYEYII